MSGKEVRPPTLLAHQLANVARELAHYLKDMGYKAPEIIAEDLPVLLERWRQVNDQYLAWYEEGSK